MEFEEAIRKMQEAQTNANNYDVGTEEIIAKLGQWAKRCDFAVTDVAHDRVDLEFQSLPDDLEAFCKEVYAFCPDTIEQGYGCVVEMLDAAEEVAEEMGEDAAQATKELQELVEGVDLEAEDYGLVLIQKDLPRKMRMTLW